MKCDSGFVLKNDDECEEIEVLDNCAFMSEKVCALCDRGYVAIKGKCQEIVVSNCGTYKSGK